MSDLTIPKELKNKIGDQLKEQIITVLKKYNKISTGKLINSIGYSTKDDSIIVAGMDYIDFIDKGRKAGKGVPLSKLRQWVKNKGIETNEQKIDRVAYMINRKIKLRGIKATPIYQPAFKQSLPLWDRLIDRIMNKELNKYLNKLLNTIK